jgi:hypothetical protein
MTDGDGDGASGQMTAVHGWRVSPTSRRGESHAPDR